MTLSSTDVQAPPQVNGPAHQTKRQKYRPTNRSQAFEPGLDVNGQDHTVKNNENSISNFENESPKDRFEQSTPIKSTTAKSSHKEMDPVMTSRQADHGHNGNRRNEQRTENAGENRHDHQDDSESDNDEHNHTSGMTPGNNNNNLENESPKDRFESSTPIKSTTAKSSHKEMDPVMTTRQADHGHNGNRRKEQRTDDADGDRHDHHDDSVSHDDKHDHNTDHKGFSCQLTSDLSSDFVSDNLETLQEQCGKFKACTDAVLLKDVYGWMLSSGEIELKDICWLMGTGETGQDQDMEKKCSHEERKAIRRSMEEKLTETLERPPAEEKIKWRPLRRCFTNKSQTNSEADQAIDKVCRCETLNDYSPSQGKDSFPWTLGLGIGCGFGVLILVLVIIGVILYRRQQKIKRLVRQNQMRHIPSATEEPSVVYHEIQDFPEAANQVSQDTDRSCSHSQTTNVPPTLPDRSPTNPKLHIGASGPFLDSLQGKPKSSDVAFQDEAQGRVPILGSNDKLSVYSLAKRCGDSPLSMEKPVEDSPYNYYHHLGTVNGETHELDVPYSRLLAKENAEDSPGGKLDKKKAEKSQDELHAAKESDNLNEDSDYFILEPRAETGKTEDQVVEESDPADRSEAFHANDDDGCDDGGSYFILEPGKGSSKAEDQGWERSEPHIMTGKIDAENMNILDEGDSHPGQTHQTDKAEDQPNDHQTTTDGTTITASTHL